MPARQEEAHRPLNGFNAAEMKVFLGREGPGTSYKIKDDAGRSGGAWGVKREFEHKAGHQDLREADERIANTMANGQPFFVQLAKQVAATEGGG